MVRLKNSHILIAVFALAALFTLFQILFMSSFQNVFTSRSLIDSKFVWINNVKELGLRITTTKTLGKLNAINSEKKNNNNWLKMNNFQTHVTNKKQKKTKKSEIFIPLDPNGLPHLVNMLPFYHKYNYFNFSSVYVYDYELEKAEIEQLGQKEQNRFVNIEEEHRLVKNIENINQVTLEIKGIDIRKANFYKPDENGQFKCLNSNVISMIFF